MEKKELLNKIYCELADSLNISDTMTQEIISSYKSVGSYLGNLEENLNIHIYPQGSMALGTLVRPIAEDKEGDYDVDLVCLLKNGGNLPAKDIKQIIGKRLSEGERYKSKLDAEGKRCWTLKYSDFHMDILPSVPKISTLPKPSRNVTQIRLTHKENDSYFNRYSDPKAYRKWFTKQMEVSFSKQREIIARNKKVEIEEVKLFDVRTPLQMTIQILKRHRDIMFSGRDNKPISIIITTLAAKSYSGETNLYEAIGKVLQDMDKHIEFNNGKAVISNPTMDSENFADKWEEFPEKQQAFFEWLNKARKDIIQEPLEFAGGMGTMKNRMRELFGSKAVNQTFDTYEEKNIKEKNKGNLGVTKEGNIGSIASSNIIAPLSTHTFYGK